GRAMREGKDDDAVMSFMMGGEEQEGWTLDTVRIICTEQEVEVVEVEEVEEENEREKGGKEKKFEWKRDFLGNILQPVILRTDRSSMKSYRSARQAMVHEDVIDVLNVLNLRKTTRQDPD